MKKIIISIVLLIIIFIGLKLNVYAATYTDEFYLSDFIDGVYYAKEKDGKIHYRKGRITKRKDDNHIVYCIEPFIDLKENQDYKGYDYNYEKILNISKEKWERVSLLAYYGYGYEGHMDTKWYSITQIMIWETLDESSSFYWTDTFKGKKVTKFVKEKKELDNLVKNHNIKPSFDNLNFNISISTNTTITDENNVLNLYKLATPNENIEIIDNNLIYKSNENHENINIELIKKDNKYKSIPIIYVSNTYQDVLAVGSYEPIKSNLSITTNSGSIKIIKQDEETQSIIPQGEATLIGTTYEIFDDSGTYINQIVIGDDSTGTLENLKYGDYILKEKNSGKGYELDTNEYKFSINNENKNVELILNNQVVKRKIKLYKFYQKEENKKEIEKNIKFQVINNKGEIFKEIITNEYGYTEFELPYGTYTIKQINTTKGYYKVDDFIITINENSKENIEYYLNDLKVPNTNQNNNNKIIYIILLISIILLSMKIKYEKEYN